MNSLSEKRKSAGYETQAAFAKALGVARVTVTKWELGAGCPRVPTLYRLSELLGVPMDEVVRAIEASKKTEGDSGSEAGMTKGEE